MSAPAKNLLFFATLWRSHRWLTTATARSVVSGQGPAEGMPVAEIRFRDVGFSYPGMSTPVLDGLDLTVAAGSSLAVVGVNGAGKSTLVKLLTKMYEPDSGRILVDGHDLAGMAADTWRERLSGALVERLPQGLDTQLDNTWAQGVELPEGQWQKVALARGHMRDHPLPLLLDEPASAPNAETEHLLFEQYAQRARALGDRDHITLLVSHRFSTVRMADLIVVLDGARVIEQGTHEDLMGLGGRYAELYGIQARAYRAQSTGE